MDRLDVERSHRAAQYKKRADRRISAAALHEYPARVRRQLDHAGQLLGRQQSRRFAHQARAARVRSTAAESAISIGAALPKTPGLADRFLPQSAPVARKLALEH